MHVLLKPLSHPGAGEIVIRDDLFLIGRNEAPFAALAGDPELTRLSRRQARIFRQNGSVYLVDLESGNGTTLNRKELRDEPVPLEHGDEICFAGHFTYRVEMIDEAESRTEVDEEAKTRLQGGAPLYVILEWKGPHGSGDRVVITQFPFLISRTDAVFSRYKDSLPADVARISRRHAYLFIRDGAACIEDLGSRNGTYLSGVRLDDQARELHDGDSLALGGLAFVFTVHVKPHLEEGTATELTATGTNRFLEECAAAAKEGAEGTIFIDSPTSFLEIFCAAGGGKAEAPPEAEPDGGPAPRPDPEAAAPPQGRLARSRAFLRQLRELFSERSEVSEKARIVRWAVAGVGVAALLAVVAVVQLRAADEREIRLLLTQEQYADAAERANAYLRTHPSDAAVSALAAEGLLKAVVPPWIDKLNRGEFAEADGLLREAGNRLASFNGEGRAMLDSLQLIGDVKEFIARRGGLDAPLLLFVHETPLRELTDRWNSRVNDLNRSLARILAYVPAFEPTYSSALTDMRALQDQTALYVKAMETLKSEIEADLAAGRADEIRSRLDGFEKKYPKVGGISGLREDLDTYIAFRNAVRDRNIGELLRLEDGLTFGSPLFTVAAQRLSRRELPPPEVLLRYRQAMELWRAGHADEAMAAMQSLAGQPWSEVAAARLDRFRKIAAAYQELERLRGKEAYGKRLVSLFHELNPEEDGAFIAALKGDYEVQKPRLIQEMENRLRMARQHWNDYLGNHGISATSRVERGVSEAYSAQARRLFLAYEGIGQVREIYGLLGETVPPAVATLGAAIVSEARRQRQWLNDLNLVLDPPVLRRKLDLLPNT
jgi:pSer/pThr/pTyr-binding forkhead associated (FHA) protein